MADIYDKLDALDAQGSQGSAAPNYGSMVQADIPWTTATTQQEVASRLNLWSTAAPALKPDMLLSFAEAGVSPTDPVGQWVIRTAVPAFGSRLPSGQSSADAQAAGTVLAKPGILYQLAQLPLDKLTDALKHSATEVGQMDEQQLARYLSTGTPDVHHGFFNRLGDIATTGVRGTLTGLQAGGEAVSGAIRTQAAGLGQAVSNIAHGEAPTAHSYAGGIPKGPQDLHVDLPNPMHYVPRPFNALESLAPNSPLFNEQAAPARTTADFRFGSPDQLLDPTQITAVSALAGNDLGGGFFPGGVAHEQAVVAQQAAASINGHALTPGRALASFVTQPGSRPYAIMSGLVDTAVALRGDPASIVLSELSSTAKAARIFAPTSEDAIRSASLHLSDLADTSEKMTALRRWAGDGDNLTEAMAHKLRTDPGSVQQLIEEGIGDHASIAHAIAADHAGMFQGLRKAVSEKDALTWLNNKAGREYADWAASHDFTDIWQRAGKKMPADVAARLADATNADDVRAILGGELGTTVRGVPSSVMPYAASRPFETLRWAHYMPRGTVDAENGDAAVEQAMRTLVGAKVPREHWDGILKPIATATNQPEMYQAYVHGLGDAVKKTLIDRGVDKGLAGDLTRFFPKDWNEQQRFFVDEIGNTPHVPGLTVGGAPIPLDGPHLPSELLNRSIPPLDMSAINRQVGIWGKAYNTPGLGSIIRGSTYLADSVTGTFKALVLLRLALPIRNLADEQARMATAGMDSAFHSPLSWIAYSVGHKGETNALGERWADTVGDMQSTFRAAVGTNSRWRNDIWQPDQIFSKHWVTYDRGTSGYTRSWADEISQLHIDPVSRQVAQAIREIAEPVTDDTLRGLDAVKQKFWDGPLAKYRQELAAAKLWGGESQQLLHNRAAADQYIDSIVDRIQIKTGGHDGLIDAIATGGPFKQGRIDKGFTRALDSLTEQGIGPTSVKGQAAEATGRRPQVMRNIVDKLFSALMDHPTQTLTRSPMFKQTYWQRVGELLPYADEATQTRLLRVARNSGITLTKPAVAQGVIDLEKVDQIAKAYGLKSTRDLLYLPGERIGATELARNIVPFGEAWRDVITNWAKLAAEHPVAIRRTQQGVTSLRESGFFHPQTDQQGNATEVFTVVPGDLMQHLAGVPFPLTAKVTGLNIIGTGLPGVGPAVQIPAAAFMPHDGPLAGFRKYLMPYGDPEFSGGAIESFFPGWLDKLKTAGWMMKVNPETGVAESPLAKLPFLGQSSDQARILSNLAKDVFQYKMSSGSYDLSNPDVLERLTKDAMADAQKLFFVRGMTQFISPAAPSVLPQSQLKDGSLVEMWKLVNDYRVIRNAHGGDSYAATKAFVDKYGPNRIFATEPKAQRVIFGVPTTAEGLVFKERHGGFVSKYPTTYGYFAPQGGSLDYQAYLDAIKRGELEPLSVTNWAKLADARLGNAIYDQARQRLPASPTPEQRNWLADVKTQITKQYPGFDDESLKVSRKSLPGTVDELRNAINDPTVRGTPLAEAAGLYIRARDQALEAARKRTGRQGTTLSGQRMDDLRGWLYQVGNAVAMRHPEFTTMWNGLFMFEVEPSDEPAVTP